MSDGLAKRQEYFMQDVDIARERHLLAIITNPKPSDKAKLILS